MTREIRRTRNKSSRLSTRKVRRSKRSTARTAKRSTARTARRSTARKVRKSPRKVRRSTARTARRSTARTARRSTARTARRSTARKMSRKVRKSARKVRKSARKVRKSARKRSLRQEGGAGFLWNAPQDDPVQGPPDSYQNTAWNLGASAIGALGSAAGAATNYAYGNPSAQSAQGDPEDEDDDDDDFSDALQNPSPPAPVGDALALSPSAAGPGDALALSLPLRGQATDSLALSPLPGVPGDALAPLQRPSPAGPGDALALSLPLRGPAADSLALSPLPGDPEDDFQTPLSRNVAGLFKDAGDVHLDSIKQKNQKMIDEAKAELVRLREEEVPRTPQRFPGMGQDEWEQVLVKEEEAAKLKENVAGKFKDAGEAHVGAIKLKNQKMIDDAKAELVRLREDVPQVSAGSIDEIYNTLLELQKTCDKKYMLVEPETSAPPPGAYDLAPLQPPLSGDAHDDEDDLFLTQPSSEEASPTQFTLDSSSIDSALKSTKPISDPLRFDPPKETGELSLIAQPVAEPSQPVAEPSQELAIIDVDSPIPEEDSPTSQPQLSDDEDSLVALFNQADKNGDGGISRAELILALRKFPELAKRLNLPARVGDDERDAFEQVYQGADTDDSRSITQNEWQLYLENKP